MKQQSEFKVIQWSQTDLEPAATGMQLSRVSAVFEADGEISGKFAVEYVMHATALNPENPHDATATYTGYLVFEGSMGGKSGSFVLEDKGMYAAHCPASALAIKPNTGAGGFAGISGGGRYYADGAKMVIALEYAL